jgi:hypothetical protein
MVGGGNGLRQQRSSVVGRCGGRRLLVAVPAAPGRKGVSEMQLKLEREDVSIALTVKAATTAKIVNPMRSTRLQPPYMDKRTSGRRKRP